VVMLSRRSLIQSCSAFLFSPLLALRDIRAAAPTLRLTGFELLPLRATPRTVWLVVRLRTDAGLTGLGEASDAFGFANTTAANAATMSVTGSVDVDVSAKCPVASVAVR